MILDHLIVDLLISNHILIRFCRCLQPLHILHHKKLSKLSRMSGVLGLAPCHVSILSHTMLPQSWALRSPYRPVPLADPHCFVALLVLNVGNGGMIMTVNHHPSNPHSLLNLHSAPVSKIPTSKLHVTGHPCARRNLKKCCRRCHRRCASAALFHLGLFGFNVCRNRLPCHRLRSAFSFYLK